MQEMGNNGYSSSRNLNDRWKAAEILCDNEYCQIVIKSNKAYLKDLAINFAQTLGDPNYELITRKALLFKLTQQAPSDICVMVWNYCTLDTKEIFGAIFLEFQNQQNTKTGLNRSVIVSERNIQDESRYIRDFYGSESNENKNLNNNVKMKFNYLNNHKGSYYD